MVDKPLDCIDAVIPLEILFKGDEDCTAFMNIVGYKLKNNGLLTIPVIGEIFANLFLKLTDRYRDPYDKIIFLQKAIDFFDSTIMALLSRERLVIAKIEDSDSKHIQRIKEIDYAITDDDALHLSSAIHKKCQRFITLDKALLSENFRTRIIDNCVTYVTFIRS